MTARRRPWRGPAMLILGILALWQLAYWVVGDLALRSPWATFEYASDLLTRPSFRPHLIETATAFGAAIVIAVAAGLSIGLLLGMSKLARGVLEPMLVAMYSIPKVTLYPILLLAFGLGMPAKIAFGAIHGFIPIALFTINAVRFTNGTHAHGLAYRHARGFARDIHRPARWILIDHDWHRIGRNVCLSTWLRLHADERHRAAQRRCHHVDHIVTGPVFRDD